jgi:hypothetical protein
MLSTSSAPRNGTFERTTTNATPMATITPITVAAPAYTIELPTAPRWTALPSMLGMTSSSFNAAA